MKSTLDVHNLCIDKRFREALPRPNDQERETLRALLKDGWNDACGSIVVWQEGDCIVDGMTRYELCVEEQIPFTYETMSFESEDAAMLWMYKLQTGRRNLDKPAFAYFWGKRYNLEKKAQGAPKSNVNAVKEQINGETDSPLNVDTKRTREKLAEQAGVAPRSIQNYGDQATVVDKLLPEQRAQFFSEELKLPVDTVKKLKPLPMEEAQKIVADIVKKQKEAPTPQPPQLRVVEERPFTASDFWQKQRLAGRMSDFSLYVSAEFGGDYGRLLSSALWDSDCTRMELQDIQLLQEMLTKFRNAMVEHTKGNDNVREMEESRVAVH